MKKALLLILLSAGAFSPAFAAEATVSHLPGDPMVELNADTLEYLASRVRASVGMERGTVVEELGAPKVVAHPNVWIYTGFRASNVYGAERYDTLVVFFKDERVAKIMLTSEKSLRAAATRAKSAEAARTASVK
jgi:hypothetical protein